MRILISFILLTLFLTEVNANGIREIFSSLASKILIQEDRLKIKIQYPLRYEIDGDEVNSRKLKVGEELVIPKEFQEILFYRRDYSIRIIPHEKGYLCTEKNSGLTSKNGIIKTREIVYKILRGEILVLQDKKKDIDLNEDKESGSSDDAEDSNESLRRKKAATRVDRQHKLEDKLHDHRSYNTEEKLSVESNTLEKQSPSRLPLIIAGVLLLGILALLLKIFKGKSTS